MYRVCQWYDILSEICTQGPMSERGDHWVFLAP